jgi:hypothetical protein
MATSMASLPLLLLLLALPAASSTFSLANTVATVWQLPVGLTTSQPCDPTLSFDLGCNSFWLRDSDWQHYTAVQASMWALVRYNLGSQQGATVVLYFPLFLADPLHSGLALARLDTVLADIRASGMQALLLIGRPDYYGRGLASSSWNPVLNPTALQYVQATLALIATPARAAQLTAISLYWMGLACHAAGPGACSEGAVRAYTAATRAAIQGSAGASTPFLQHLDGPFWDACYPQPCAAWNFGGYSPASLTGVADGLLAESWVMGSLQGGVRTLYALGVVTNTTLLLVDDIPNCDAFPASHPCATGSLAGDVRAWEALVQPLGLSNTWAVWAAVDGGLGGTPNYYGDLLTNGTGLTSKGQLHRARALAGGRNASASGL